jgi:exopolysaccharide production protein ExoY
MRTRIGHGRRDGSAVAREGTPLSVVRSDAEVDDLVVVPDRGGADDVVVLVPDLDAPDRRPQLEPSLQEALPQGSRVVRAHPIPRAAKRALDIIVSLALLILTLPILLLISAAIVLDSRGPVLFVQRRVGRDGKQFPLFKFRTMVADGESAIEGLVAGDEQLRLEWERSRKLRQDPRVTRVGAFFRKHSVDELPQILNVLVGNMSLVGPRPVRQDEIALFGERAAEVLSVRPGLTGKWAVSGRSDLSYADRAELECRYVREWSFRRDLRILLRTIPVVLHGHGAY